MERTKVLKVRKFKAGYEVRTEWIDDTEEGGTGFEMKSAYTPFGDYIGDPKMAYYLCKKMGITPSKIDKTRNICSIGFSEKENAWAGWSHRALCFFGLGDKIFEADFGDDDTPYKKHGRVVIETVKQAREAAVNFAEYVS